MSSEVLSEKAAQQPSSNHIARRSVSIFSRKGTDSPPQTTQAFPFPSSNLMFNPSLPASSGSSSMSRAKSKRWTLTGRVEQTPRGTILRAVPKDAPKNVMTPLEREMATSPNEEILRAIGLTPDSAPTSPIDRSPSSPLGEVANMAPRRYYSKRGKQAQGDYLGVWHNGQVSWGKENTTKPVNRLQSLQRPKTSDGSTRPLGPNGLPKQSISGKPRIKVIIPDDHLAKRPYSFVPFYQPGPTGAGSISSALVSPPSATSGLPTSFGVSAISPPTAQKSKPQRPFQPINVAIDESLAFDGAFLEAARPPHSRTISENSSSNSDSEGDDHSLARSSRSSMTSIGVHNEESQKRKEPLSRRGSSSSEASFEANEDAIGIDNNKKTNDNTTIDLSSSQNKAIQGPRMSDVVSLIRESSTVRRSASISRTASGRCKRLSSSRGQRLLANVDSQEELKFDGGETPTLDDAVKDLETSLSSLSYDTDGADAPEVVQAPSVANMSPIPEIMLTPVDVPPALPRKSSRRTRASFSSQDVYASQNIVVEAPSFPIIPNRRNPYRASAPPTISGEQFNASMEAERLLAQRREQMHSLRRERRESYRLRRRSSVRSVLSLVREEDEFPSVETNTAEQVVYHILSQLSSMDDLFNAALITKGFHLIFKQNELELMRNALQKECAPAWEYRESCLGADEEEDNSAAPTPTWTPSTYFRGYKADMAVMNSIKALVLEQCSSLLCADTLGALQRGDTTRVDAALFRIWTFCHIFGYGKGREDDITAQMDWLRGGLIAHQDTCSSTISHHDAFCISTVLLNAPEHFAQGNEGGLTAENLYDMLEMWKCLQMLTKRIVGKTQQARQFGVFDDMDVEGGDVDGEEAMLEEWHAYIMTLGLATMLDVASALVSGGTHAAFAVAQYNRYTFWPAPMVGSSRTSFLYEAVSRLYEERLCETFSPEDIQMSEMQSIRRNRDSHYRQRRASARVPERASSLNRDWGSFRSSRSSSRPTSGHSFGTTPGLARSVSTRAPSRPQIPHISTLMSSNTRHSYYPPVAETIVEEQLPIYNREADRQREIANMHPLQMTLHDPNPGTNSAEKAVLRIVEMGFTTDEAKGALKLTDMGDGLRIDRAVEYLMRSKGWA